MFFCFSCGAEERTRASVSFCGRAALQTHSPGPELPPPADWQLVGGPWPEVFTVERVLGDISRVPCHGGGACLNCAWLSLSLALPPLLSRYSLRVGYIIALEVYENTSFSAFVCSLILSSSRVTTLCRVVRLGNWVSIKGRIVCSAFCACEA